MLRHSYIEANKRGDRMPDERETIRTRGENAGPHPANQIRIATETFAESADKIHKCAMQYKYDTWRVRVMDAQRSSVHFVNSIGKTATELASATLIYQANGYSFTTAHNACLGDQTAPIVTPYTLTVGGDKDTPLRQRPAQLFYDGSPVRDIERLRLCDIMEAVSLWYFERKDSSGVPLPEKVFVNPVLGCALRCKTCSRLAFLNRPLEYRHNVDKITDEIASQVENRNDVKVVNISTGTLPTAEEDFDAFTAIVESFRRKDFTRARFSIQTSTIFNDHQLRQLAALGVDRFSITMDGTSDEVLAKLYRGKGMGTIDGYAAMAKMLEDRFQKVAIHVILGNDSVEIIKRTVERFAKQGRAAIHHYIPRIFHPSQYSILHSDATKFGVEYYVALIRFIDDLNDARMPKMDLLNPFYGLQPDEFMADA